MMSAVSSVTEYSPCSAMPILVVDDDESFRTALAANLRDDGHAVRECADPAEVLLMADLGDVALVITDYQMPGLDGLAFADAFHAVYVQVPVVLLSASALPPRRPAAARGEFLHMRQKPVDYDELHQLLHQLSPRPAV
jgi:DNA-binding NtrC family response regulator